MAGVMPGRRRLRPPRAHRVRGGAGLHGAASPPGRWPGARGLGPGRCSFLIRRLVTHTRARAISLSSGSGTVFIHERGPFGSAWGLTSPCEDRYSGAGASRAAPAPAGQGLMAHAIATPIDPPRGIGAGPGRRGQVHKGTGGMPRRHQMAGVLAAISPGELPKERRSRNARRRPGELKHLSTRRNGNQPRLPQ